MFNLNRIACWLYSCSVLVISSTSQASTESAIQSTGLQNLAKAELIQPIAPERKIAFTVWLKGRHQKELIRLAQEVYNPDSPLYHHFLTPALYETRFAPSKKTEAILQQWFRSYGMQADTVNHSIRVIGTAQQIKQALHVSINEYRYQGKVVYAHTGAPRLQKEMAQFIAEITGLNSFPEFHSDGASRDDRADQEQALHFIWNGYTPSALPTTISLQGFSGANLQKTYGIGTIPAINGVQIDGSGQTLVIVDKCGTNGPKQILRDANQYFNENNIPPFVTSGVARNFAIVNPDGSSFKQCPGATDFNREIVLDIESSHTIAPKDNTVLVLTANGQRTALMDTIHTLVQNKYTIAGFANAYVISNSWSSAEGNSVDTTLESTLALAAAAGISVNFSSGDCGDNTYVTATKCTGVSSSPVVDYPSSSAYVTAVGATAMFVDTNYRYAFETVWGTVRQRQDTTYAYDGGTSGGISALYGPVTWQNSIYGFTAGGYGVLNQFGSRRALPDIAMLGDPSTGLLIVADGAQVKDGGTSLACPLFSATLLLVNQARALLNKQTPIGQAAPYLYIKNNELVMNKAIHLIIPPAVIISGATPPPDTVINNTPAPASAFTINNTTLGWDSSLTIEPEHQFWNDAVGIGSPNIPNFVMTMANM